jgi:hypothetical protein
MASLVAAPCAPVMWPLVEVHQSAQAVGWWGCYRRGVTGTGAGGRRGRMSLWGELTSGVTSMPGSGG